MDVYDEKCETKYPAKCVEDKSCTMIYQTQCDTAGYSQKCQQVPMQKCDPITKCHRIPKTTCRTFKTEKCGNARVPVPTKQMKSKCLPYEARQPEPNMENCKNNNDAAPGSSYGAPSSGYGTPAAPALDLNGVASGSGYGAPASNNYNAPTVADMQAPLPVPPAPVPPAPPNLTPNNRPSYGGAGAIPAAPAPDTYGSPVSAPINNNPAPDTYGTPVAAPINNVNQQNPFITTVPASTVNNNLNPLKNMVQEYNIGSNIIVQQGDSVSAPSVYASPSFNPPNQQKSNFNSLINPRLNSPSLTSTFPGQRIQEETRSSSTLATIRVVDPPSISQGPLIPILNNPIASSIQTQG